MSHPSRRKFGRFHRVLSVELSVVGEMKLVHTENLSIGGMLVTTDQAAAFGDEVEFRLHLPDPAHAIQARGSVMWAHPGSMGVAFESLRPLDVWALLQYFTRSTAAGEPGERVAGEDD